LGQSGPQGFSAWDFHSAQNPHLQPYQPDFTWYNNPMQRNAVKFFLIIMGNTTGSRGRLPRIYPRFTWNPFFTRFLLGNYTLFILSLPVNYKRIEFTPILPVKFMGILPSDYSMNVPQLPVIYNLLAIYKTVNYT
jgi:hypothetical protein